MENNNASSYEEMNQIVIAKADELSKSLGLKVMPLLHYYKPTDEWIVGYVKEPNRSTIRVAVDKLEKFGKLDAGDLILQTCLIEKESDSRIMDENMAYNGINSGACLEVLNLIEINLSLVKKNTSNTK